MALVRFKASPLPNAPATYDPQYIRQLIRALEIYFSQLDSLAPNQAQSYTADQFIGGAVLFGNYTTIEQNALVATIGMVVFNTTLGKLCVYYNGVWETVVTTRAISVSVTGVSATASVGSVTVTV